jgi:putative cell wall-binding protein
VRRAAPLVLIAVLAGCGSNSKPAPFAPEGGETKTTSQPPVERVAAVAGLATKNTTRVAGADPIADGAGVAQVVYPAQTANTRPAAVVLAGTSDWRSALAASVLAAPPIRAPILLSGAAALAPVTRAALTALKPTGSGQAGGAKVIRIGAVPKLPAATPTTDITSTDPVALAAAIDRFQTAALGKPSPAVVVVSRDAPAFAMPAAGWAARSGDSVLFVTSDTVPPATAQAIRTHQRPRIYVLGPPSVISDTVERALGKLGSSVTRIAGATPVDNAIAFARYLDPQFGWGIRDPGHGLVFANASRPLDAAAAAPLSGSGTYGPLLLVDRPAPLPPTLAAYLLDIQPGYKGDPTRGVYNHGWLIGDGRTISVPTQAAIDRLLEIAPVKTPTTTP